MKEIIDVVRQQLVLVTRLNEVTEKNRELLVKTDAKEARKSILSMEPILTKLGALEKRQQQLLTDRGGSTLAEWIQQQAPSLEKQIAENLLGKLTEQLGRLKSRNSENLHLLERNIKFIDYNINVMTQTTAEVTYGAPQGSGGGPVQGRKIFDTGV